MIVKGIGGGGGGGAAVTGTPFDIVNINAGGTQAQDSGWSRDTDTGLTANSDLRFPTQKAIKTYVDGAVSAVPQLSVKSYGALGDAQQFMDGSMTTGSAILTSVANRFVVGDVGKSIAVQFPGLPTEDYTTYTKVDPGSAISLAKNTITVTSLASLSDSRVYKDFGASYFSGDFTHYVDWQLSHGTGSYLDPWGVSTVTTDLLPTNGNNLAIQTGNNGTTVWLIENYGGSQFASTGITVTNNTHLYATVQRSGTTLTLKLYSDSLRTVQVGATQTLTLHATVSYQYLFGLSTLNAGSTNVSGTINNTSITPYALTNLITTILSYQSATQVTLNNTAPGSGSGLVFSWGTDNTTPFQNAIDAGRTLGTANVIVPFGKYLLIGSVNLWSGVTLAGAATGPWYSAGVTPMSQTNIPELWLLNTAEPAIKLFYRTTGNTTNTQPTITGIPSTAKMTVGMYFTVVKSDGTLVMGGTIISIDSSTQVTLSVNANFTGSVTMTAGITSPTVQDLQFYYPNQLLHSQVNAPFFYPPTIQAQGNWMYKIHRCSFVNSYQAIGICSGYSAFGTLDPLLKNNTVTQGFISDLVIGSLYVAFAIDRAYDTLHMSRIHIHNYYNWYGPDQPAADNGQTTNFDKWVLTNGYGMIFFRIDDFQGEDVFMFMKGTGLYMTDGVDAGASYGRITNLEMDQIRYGIRMKSSASFAGWQVTNVGFIACTVTNFLGQYASYFDSGGIDFPILYINGGKLQTNATFQGANGPFYQNGVASSQLSVQNLYGYNPKGAQSAPGVPASGTALVNPFPFPCRVFITGGTVSAIAIGTTATGLIAGTFDLFPNESIKLTYTGAPTWTWFGL